MNKMNECYECIHKGGVPGSCHSSCKKPDPEMTGDPHGVKNGWFFYPSNFDPTWKTSDCSNFENKDQTSKTSSQSSM